MNILKNVINKLSQEEKKEVNLASEKINLGLIDDLKKLGSEASEISELIGSQSSDLSKLFLEIRNSADKFNSLNDNRNNQIKKGKTIFKELNSKLDTIQKQAKDLGLSPKDIPNYSKSLTANSSLRAETNDYQRYSNIKI